MEILAAVGFVVVVIICIRIYLRTSIRFMTPRVAQKVLDRFSPHEWFSLEDCASRVSHDEMICAFAITHLYNDAHMLEYRLNPIEDVEPEHYDAILAYIARNGMHPIFAGFLKFRIVGTGQRPKRSLTDIMKGALQGVLGPKGLPEPA